ncbi:MAG TPA: nuclear transport factor 2 family protein [Polyangia bacterium]|nr:nuclear transport factor 2 family protein [Polyangia bacterium]
MSKDRKTLTLEYLNAVGKQQYDRLEAMLAPDLQFRGPSMTRTSAGEFLGALKRLGAIHVRNDVKRVFVDGDEVCVIYDFVTDTQAGALPTIEWLRFDGDRIGAIDLYYDRLPWQAVMAVIAERSARPAASAVV